MAAAPPASLARPTGTVGSMAPARTPVRRHPMPDWTRALQTPARRNSGVDAGADAGPDAGPFHGFDAGFDGGPVDAGFCVISGNSSTLPDLPDPRAGLGAAYIAFSPAAGQTFERIFTVGGLDPTGLTTADVELDELESEQRLVGRGPHQPHAARALRPDLAGRHRGDRDRRRGPDHRHRPRRHGDLSLQHRARRDRELDGAKPAVDPAAGRPRRRRRAGWHDSHYLRRPGRREPHQQLRGHLARQPGRRLASGPRHAFGTPGALHGAGRGWEGLRPQRLGVGPLQPDELGDVGHESSRRRLELPRQLPRDEFGPRERGRRGRRQRHLHHGRNADRGDPHQHRVLRVPGCHEQFSRLGADPGDTHRKNRTSPLWPCPPTPSGSSAASAVLPMAARSAPWRSTRPSTILGDREGAGAPNSGSQGCGRERSPVRAAPRPSRAARTARSRTPAGRRESPTPDLMRDLMRGSTAEPTRAASMPGRTPVPMLAHSTRASIQGCRSPATSVPPVP